MTLHHSKIKSFRDFADYFDGKITNEQLQTLCRSEWEKTIAKRSRKDDLQYGSYYEADNDPEICNL